MTTALWTLEEIAAAVDGRLDGPDREVFGVAIDSRSVEPGDLFVALSGETQDGHAFVADALGRGAAAALVARAVDGPSVVATDTHEALRRLAAAALDRAKRARRVAVTGSVGKTTVTQALADSLSAVGATHRSKGSLNNHVGVPLTLARMPADTEFAVVEVGMNHAEEIRPLTKLIRPDVAIVTAVGPVHVGNFGDEGERGVARAKAEIFDGLAPGGAAVLDRDGRWFDLLREAAAARGARILAAGEGPDCAARLRAFSWDDARSHVEFTLGGREIALDLAHPGAHWGLNCMLIALAMDAVGAPLAPALERLAAFRPPSGRGNHIMLQVTTGSVLLIDDSYNANSLSMQAAIRTLAAQAAKGRRLMAVTDMLELGAHGPAAHVALAGDMVDAGIDLAFAAGDLMKDFHDVLPPRMRGGWAQTADELAPLVYAALDDGDIITVKGSHGSRAFEIAAELVRRSAGRTQGA